MKVFKKSSLLLLVGLATLVACNKDTKDDPKPTDPVTTEKAFTALKEFAETGNQFTATMSESGGIVDNTGLEPTRLYGTRSFPIVSCEAQGDGTWLVTCNYGPTLILCDDGYLRRGVVNILTTGLFITTGTVMTVTFDNFYQKGDWPALEYKIDGTQIITNAGANTNDPGMTDYTVEVVDGTITYNTKEVHYSETTTRTLASSVELCQNNWYITGEWNGVSSDNVPYTLKADQTPLRYRVCCHFFQDGILKIDVEGLSPFLIDYGYTEDESDECDRKARLYYPGISPIVIDM